MDESVRLGKVAGVPVGANWSLLVIFWLFVISLAGAQLPHSAPGHLAPAYYLTAVAVTAVFYACLLAHELAHAIVARRHGIGVHGIVLWLLGGVSKLDGEPVDPDVEVRIAGAGPATSLALAFGFFVLSRLAGTGLLAAGLGWLGWINGLLAVFNLLPAFPLDGGRVLRAMLWRHYGDKARATSAAADVGRIFGFGFIAVGVVGFVGTSLGFSALWLAVIGWFLVATSRREAQASTLGTELAGLTVRDAMTGDPLTVPAWVTLDRLWDQGVQARRVSSFPVVDLSADFAGLVTVARMRRVPTDRWPVTTVGAIACPPAQCVVARPDDDMTAVAHGLARSPDRRAVVVVDGRVVGILTPSDVDRAAASAARARHLTGQSIPTPGPSSDPAAGHGADVVSCP
jgi:Zn-dependent protease/CBS domain-containing protein